jgi:protocatechuate 3,4-dioxygenase beta subunit
VAAAVTGAWKLLAPDRAGAEAAVATVSCVLTPEQTEGPYYISREKVRSVIRENRPGTPLQLKLQVVDARTCAPIKNAAVDIWHCDAGGIYSGFEAASTGAAPGASGPTDKDTFLRGIQMTNARGLVSFKTIYPGWYRGRTVHIHVKVHLGGDTIGHVVHTGQLYFHDNLTGKVYQRTPYKSRAAARDTFNNTDGIFQHGGAQSMLTVHPDGTGGYVATITMGVRRSA